MEGFLYLTVPKVEANRPGSLSDLINFLPGAADHEAGGQELEEHVDGGRGGLHRDGDFLFEVHRGQDRPEKSLICS